MQIVLASRNKKKISELKTLLSERFPGCEVLSPDDIGIDGEIEETGETFEENALIKARACAGHGYISVADDSGIEVDALGNRPGVYSARYAGEHGNDEKNNDKLLSELESVPDGERGARYTCVVACVFPDGRYFTVRGECRGRILRERHGTGGFGYDPLFYVEEYGRTMAEITPEEKNRISHRGKAMRKFAEEFEKYI